MPTGTKALDNQDKHLTDAERAAREAAERDTLPQRDIVRLVMPPYVKSDAAAKRYWDSILKRAEGIKLLDDLDAEMLAVYVTMLSRRDALSRLLKTGIREAKRVKMTTDERLAALGKVDSLNSRVMSMERNILQYADKLGLTPAGRIRLAQKRAEAAVTDPEEDLYGD